jgi:hypothetical protein
MPIYHFCAGSCGGCPTVAKSAKLVLSQGRQTDKKQSHSSHHISSNTSSVWLLPRQSGHKTCALSKSKAWVGYHAIRADDSFINSAVTLCGGFTAILDGTAHIATCSAPPARKNRCRYRWCDFEACNGSCGGSTGQAQPFVARRGAEFLWAGDGKPGARLGRCDR